MGRVCYAMSSIIIWKLRPWAAPTEKSSSCWRLAPHSKPGKSSQRSNRQHTHNRAKQQQQHTLLKNLKLCPKIWFSEKMKKLWIWIFVPKLMNYCDYETLISTIWIFTPKIVNLLKITIFGAKIQIQRTEAKVKFLFKN